GCSAELTLAPGLAPGGTLANEPVTPLLAHVVVRDGPDAPSARQHIRTVLQIGGVSSGEAAARQYLLKPLLLPPFRHVQDLASTDTIVDQRLAQASLVLVDRMIAHDHRVDVSQPVGIDLTRRPLCATGSRRVVHEDAAVHQMDAYEPQIVLREQIRDVRTVVP